MKQDPIQQLSQQVADLDKKFDTNSVQISDLNTKVTGLDTRLANAEHSLDRIAVAISKKADKADMDARFDEVNDKIDRLLGLADAILKSNETHEQERLASNRQLDRHENWIERAAAKLEIQYDPAG